MAILELCERATVKLLFEMPFFGNHLFAYCLRSSLWSLDGPADSETSLKMAVYRSAWVMWQSEARS